MQGCGLYKIPAMWHRMPLRRWHSTSHAKWPLLSDHPVATI